MKRQDVLILMGGAGAAMVLPPAKLMARDNPKADPLSGDRLYGHVVHYTQIGEHRTGTTGDRLTAERIRRELESYGLEATFHPVTMHLFEVTAGFLEAARRRETARLVAQGREENDAQALNVTGTIGSGNKQIIVTTPQSVMFRCGG
jgi:hypothetical protein